MKLTPPRAPAVSAIALAWTALLVTAPPADARVPTADEPMVTRAVVNPAPAAGTTPDPSADARKGKGRFPFEESVLGNGLRVISLEDHSAPIVAVQLWYHVGSKDEHPERQGFAHMFEHMMFRGTDRLGPKDHFEYIRGTGGNTNAYTSFDQTVYVQEFPSNQLEMVLWLEAERMASLKIDEGGFATERKVVEEERRLGLNQPYGSMLEQVLEGLFNEHPYRWSPIGKIEHLRASTVDDIQHFWDTYYVPNNATLVVVGDVEHDQVRALAGKYFGWIPRCPEPPRVTIVEPPQTEGRTFDLQDDNAPVPLTGIAFHTVPEKHPDALPLNMLMQILGGGESSRLYVDIVRRKEVGVVGLGAHATFEQAGLAICGGMTMPFGDTDAVQAAIWEQIDEVRENGVTDDELEKVRNQLYRNDVAESLTIASKANALGNAAVILGDTQLANTYLERVMAVSTDDIQRVANTYLQRERANTMTVKPTLMSTLKGVLSAASAAGGGEAEDEGDDEEEVEGGVRAVATGPKADAERPEWMGDAPPVADPLDADLSLGGVARTLDNGLKLVVVENHEVPWVSSTLRLRPGAYTEGSERPGTASMALNMITRGTFVRDAEEMAVELESHGISISASAGHDGASVNLSGVKKEFGRTVRLMSEVVQVPAFDGKEFKTLRDQLSTGKTVEEKTPSSIATREFDRALWGNHPYARPSDGTADDLKQLDVEQLEAWWTTWAAPEHAVLYVAGDITADEAFETANRYLGSWEGEGEAPNVEIPAVKPPKGTRILLVDTPGAIQSEIRAGHEGITRDHDLYPTGVVLSQVFGGGFNSRLNDVIRVQKGLTYGARGGLSSSRFGGSFTVSTFTKTPTTAETVQAVIDEVKRMRDEPPSEKELSQAVSYMAGSFAGTLETPQAVAGRLWTLEVNDLPGNYWDEYLKRIAATSSEDVARAADELLDPERLVIVVVGDADKVREQLEEIAPVEVVSSGG